MPEATQAAVSFYWTRFSPHKLPPGDQLAALRRGLGREAGTVPAMWPYYLRLNPAGSISDTLRAEHLALTLFAVHQQSVHDTLMHRTGIGLGSALRAVREHPESNPAGIDRRFGAAATAGSFAELAGHLRTLVSHLNQIHQPMDYTQLVRDLILWQRPDRKPGIRRRWGMAYFAPSTTGTDPSTTPEPASQAQEAS